MEVDNKEGLPSDYTFKGKGYNCHYTEHKNYDLWKIASSWIGDDEGVLDIGCGTGQFGHMLVDKGVTYAGLDFSPHAISAALELNVKHSLNTVFILSDIKDIFIESCHYDVYVLFSVLEHIQNDRDIVERIPSGKKIIFIVPNFKYIYHVRIFRNKEEIRERYIHLIDIEEIIMEKRRRGNRQFLVRGTRR